ncbi:Gx transporter family protein [Hydrogenophilus thermoluteolus]|uniref:Gx transporter family protein n=1 Tax=Hydrogenophilus thermoluteolus TaxID=297 RepID=UPI003F66A31C
MATHAHLTPTAEDHRIARWSGAAIAFSIAEAAIPLPIPGVKPGVANIVVLWVGWRHGWQAAAWVSLLRVFAASIALGQLFAPGFFLALAGAIASLAALAVALRLPRRLFGPVTASLLMAWAHIWGQLILARLWLVPHDGLWWLLPVFLTTATLFGLANGLVAAYLLAHLPNDPDSAAPAS